MLHIALAIAPIFILIVLGHLLRRDGDAGLDLVPSPALLARLMDVQGTVDEYLLWTISEGGAPFGTAMPAFKNRLTEDQIWQIVAYLRAGFPQEN